MKETKHIAIYSEREVAHHDSVGQSVTPLKQEGWSDCDSKNE